MRGSGSLHHGVSEVDIDVGDAAGDDMKIFERYHRVLHLSVKTALGSSSENTHYKAPPYFDAALHDVGIGFARRVLQCILQVISLSNLIAKKVKYLIIGVKVINVSAEDSILFVTGLNPAEKINGLVHTCACEEAYSLYKKERDRLINSKWVSHVLCMSARQRVTKINFFRKSFNILL